MSDRKTAEKYDIDWKKYERMDGEDDMQYYRRLAKTADQRLVRLEALHHEKHYHHVDEYAYARAMRDIESWGGKKRFNTAPPKLENGEVSKVMLREKIEDIKRFLNSPTSTKKGVKAVYMERVDKLNERYAKDGLKLTWTEFADLTESGTFDRLKSDTGSDTTFAAIAWTERKSSDIMDAVKALRSHTHGAPRTTYRSDVNDKVYSILSENPGMSDREFVKEVLQDMIPESPTGQAIKKLVRSKELDVIIE